MEFPEVENVCNRKSGCGPHLCFAVRAEVVAIPSKKNVKASRALCHVNSPPLYLLYIYYTILCNIA